MTDAERARRYRDRKRGGPPRPAPPHGTTAAVSRHRRAGESLAAATTVCPACTEHVRVLNQRRRKGS